MSTADHYIINSWSCVSERCVTRADTALICVRLPFCREIPTASSKHKNPLNSPSAFGSGPVTGTGVSWFRSGRDLVRVDSLESWNNLSWDSRCFPQSTHNLYVIIITITSYINSSSFPKSQNNHSRVSWGTVRSVTSPNRPWILTPVARLG